MGRFVNPDNSAFQVALNSKIYVDKPDCWNIQTASLIRWMHISVTVARADLENPLLQICLLHIIAGDASQERCFPD